MEMLNLYDLFVEYVFGGFFLSVIGIAAILALIAILSKMSPTTMIYIILLFVMSCLVGWGGSLIAFIVFILAFLYYVAGLTNFINSRR